MTAGTKGPRGDRAGALCVSTVALPWTGPYLGINLGGSA